MVLVVVGAVTPAPGAPDGRGHLRTAAPGRRWPRARAAAGAVARPRASRRRAAARSSRPYLGLAWQAPPAGGSRGHLRRRSAHLHPGRSAQLAAEPDVLREQEGLVRRHRGELRGLREQSGWSTVTARLEPANLDRAEAAILDVLRRVRDGGRDGGRAPARASSPPSRSTRSTSRRPRGWPRPTARPRRRGPSRTSCSIWRACARSPRRRSRPPPASTSATTTTRACASCRGGGAMSASPATAGLPGSVGPAANSSARGARAPSSARRCCSRSSAAPVRSPTGCTAALRQRLHRARAREPGGAGGRGVACSSGWARAGRRRTTRASPTSSTR